MNIHQPTDRGYVPISDHALIGNLRTAALVSLDGSIESYCVPNFDSPSVFARILDKDKGGHFSITPRAPFTTKQNYFPSSNVLQTKFLNDKGVVNITDYLPRKPSSETNVPFLFWLIRRVEVVRGSFPLRMECAPAFDYARAKHTTEIIPDDSHPGEGQNKVLFRSDHLSLDLRFLGEHTMECVDDPIVDLKILDLTPKGHLGLSAYCDLDLTEGQVVTFILRTPPEAGPEAKLTPTTEKAQSLGLTNSYWNSWVRRSAYQGSWKEAVHRSALALKLLIFEPTGKSSPTFSLPEYIGGTRNWSSRLRISFILGLMVYFRASWIRDSSFTLYALIRLGYTYEANAYMEFIFERLKDKNPDGSLQIMYTIHGGKDLEEIELTHLDGHKGSKPVRIGNGAADHLQLDIYGELMDCVYLGQKFGKPLQPDLYPRMISFIQTLITLGGARRRVAIDRGEQAFTGCYAVPHATFGTGLRLADKRSLPCPKRNEWITARDELYEEIMLKAWNPELKCFGQSYEETNVLDSSVLIMPLVFFIQPSDPRFVNTLKQILKTPDRGGLTSNNLVYRYDVKKSDDGVGGEEGTFCLCTLWCIEALTRAGTYDKALLQRAISMFEDFLLYTNHVGLCTEEISEAGEGLGNAVQGFTHVTLISAAYNLSRTLGQVK
ncbi:glycoside hydrolase family 15 protein [Piloderma croceum F 1598]|uniref:Glycoside hydrolase family 15 protein n=1 Tax=Piloderma croceum (strain F 1598) TaxID=765440 RepID=A0A0C3C1L1_PILCF|nr:glycoside hydrolase family 15 protein [Piloderma croceum F 1598]